MRDGVVAELASGAEGALAMEDAEGSFTRAELAAAVAGAASALRRAGVSPGSRVAVAAPPSTRAVAALLGSRAAGATTFPVDPRQAPAALSRIAPAAVIAEAPVPGYRTLELRGLFEPGRRLDPLPGPPHAWGLSTSGTSGRARTVLLSEASVARMTASLLPLVDYRSDDRVLCCLPFHHVYGLSQIWFALRAGAALVMPPSPLLPGDLLRWATRASVLPAVPPTMRWLSTARGAPRLRLVTLSGQATTPEDRRSFAAAFPETAFVQFYGLTEGFRLLWLPREEFLSRPEATGRPTPGVRVWLDGSRELWAEGPNVAAEYLDDPQATAERFPAAGVLRTGDLFERDGDGFRYVGRHDGVFKSFGEKVVPEVVERALQAHPGVESCLVAPDRLNGHELRPVAWIVARSPAPPAPEILRFLRARVPSAMVPAELRFVEALPRTASGKVIRRAPDAA